MKNWKTIQAEYISELTSVSNAWREIEGKQALYVLKVPHQKSPRDFKFFVSSNVVQPKPQREMKKSPARLSMKVYNLPVLLENMGVQMVGRKTEWRTTERVVGEVNGLPQSRGVLVATDGIECLIEQARGFYLSHSGWFIPDKVEEEETMNISPPKAKKKKLEVVDVSDMTE